MSLINEALKRTRDASYQPASAPPPSAPNYRLNDSATSTTLSLKGGIAASILVLVVAVGLASFIALRKIAPARTADEVLALNAPATTPPPAPPAAEAKTSKATEEQLVTRVVEKLKTETPPAAPPAPPRESPKLVLQGITSDGGVYEAMINGSNLREGEDIEGARVVAIESRRVRLQLDGREIVLRMP
jgi:hypothetical protein